MCQWALFSREAELNINSPRHTMLQEALDLSGEGLKYQLELHYAKET